MRRTTVRRSTIDKADDADLKFAASGSIRQARFWSTVQASRSRSCVDPLESNTSDRSVYDEVVKFYDRRKV